MTPYDVAMVAAIVAGMVWGAWRGITWQLASILSLGLGYAVAVPMSAQLRPALPRAADRGPGPGDAGAVRGRLGGGLRRRLVDPGDAAAVEVRGV